MEHSISQKIIRNTIFNAIGRFWGILVSLFLTPYIIHHIGLERFGIWAVVGVLTGYFGLLDFGIGTSFVKYISEFYAKKNYESINHIINTGFVFYAIFAVFIAVIGFIFINLLLTLFNIPKALYNEAVFVFLLGIILLGVSNALSPFGAIQGGLQRMDISNKVGMVISIPNIAGTIFFLESGYGLPGLMVNNAIILVISSLANLIIAFKILPELRFNLLLFSKKMFKKLFSFGYKLQVVKMSSLAGPQTDKLLITHFLNLGLVTFYQLGNTIIEQVKGLSLLVISALLPAVSELDANKEISKIKLLYLESIKYIVFITLPLSFFLIINARLIILTWMNQDFEKAALSLQILSIGFFINILTGPAAVVVQGMGKPEYHMRLSLAHLFLNLFLSIFLIIKFGFIGVLIGTSLSYFLTGSYFIYSVSGLLRISFAETYKFFFKALMACFLAILFSCYIKFFLIPASFGLNRLLNFVILLCIAFVFGGVYILVLSLIRYFDKDDITLLKKTFSSIFINTEQRRT